MCVVGVHIHVGDVKMEGISHLLVCSSIPHSLVPS